MIPSPGKHGRRQAIDPELDDQSLPAPFQTATPVPSRTEDSDKPITIEDDEMTERQTRSEAERTTASRSNDSSTTNRSTLTISSSRTSTSSRTTPSSTSSSRLSSMSSEVPSTTSLSSSILTRTGSLPSESMIWPNSFPPDFPVETHEPVKVHSGGRGYAFMKDNELLDSLLIFVSFVFTSLVLTVILIKSTHIMSRRSGSKGDQMVGDEMRWAERREVLERKIIWEGGGGQRIRGRSDKMGRGAEAQLGLRELSERERLKGKQR